MFKSYVSLIALATAAPAIAQSNAVESLPSADAAADAIVVTASRSGDAIPVDQLGSSVTVLDPAALDLRQTRIVSDVLRDVPGLAVSRSGAIGGMTQVRIRGSESNHVLVLIDGIKASDPYNGEYDFGTLIADDAARIEVLRGQQSALYGSDAIGGVISYTTLDGREAPGYRARIEGGSFGTYSGSARAAGVAGETLDYALSSSYYHTDGTATARDGDRDLGSNSLGASGKVNWTPAPNFKVTAVGRYSYTKADTNQQAFPTGGPVVAGYPVYAVVDTPGEYFKNKAYYGLVRAQLDLFDDAWTNAVSAQIADTRRDGFESYGRASGDKGVRYRGSFDSTVRFGNDHVRNRFTMAVDAERETFRNTAPGGFSFNDKHTVDTVGFVSQYDVVIDDRLALGASARIDENDIYDDATTVRATGSYLFPTGTRIHGAYGSGIKAPTAGELYGYSDGKYVGNPDLKPERSTGWEAGVEQTLLAGKVTFGATYFDNRFKDQIDSTFIFSGGQFLQTTFNNDVRTKQRGVETYAAARFGDWRLDASYTYLHAPQTISAVSGPAPADGGFEPDVPTRIQAVRRAKNIASANLSWQPATLPVTATLTVRYNGKQGDYAFNPNFQRLIVDLGAYTLVNVAATYDITKNLQVFGRVENLFDENYEEVFTFATPGRAAYGGLRVKL